MLSIQPGCVASTDKELTAVRIRARVGHTQRTSSTVRNVKVLVGKRRSENALSSRPVSICKVAPVITVRTRAITRCVSFVSFRLELYTRQEIKIHRH
jgi:hypothetical protein